jgi:hypothetical protein
MFVFRSLSVGLLAACFALLVARPTVELRVAHESASTYETAAHAGVHDPAQRATIALPAPEPPAPTIIDVAPGVTAMQLAATIHLRAGEQIVAVDDVAVTGDLGAGILLASRDLRSRQFIDVSVAGPEGERRVLALLH